jgi:hypothetical protein
MNPKYLILITRQLDTLYLMLRRVEQKEQKETINTITV